MTLLSRTLPLSALLLATWAGGAAEPSKGTAPVHVRKPLPPAEEVAKLPPDGGAEFNRLIFETSPYLRQHARNPVDWYPWGDEAFARARKENKPIFLSVGYSSCHWCHVMEHESFEDDQVADLLNHHFISVKVDREERPDIDQIYMSATQVMTGRGGWPNTVFLDLEKRPFFAGTYFPKKDRGGQPGFVTLLHKLKDVWKAQPEVVTQTSLQIQAEIQRLATMTNHQAVAEISAELMAKAGVEFAGEFDAKHGGFGDAPKFPPHATLGFLLQAQSNLPEPAREPLIRLTLDQMALGGIHDHVGGGFHRYATDGIWFLPHFEKMLYDNAQLARLYARAFALTRNPAYRSVAEDTLEWCLRDLRHPQGGFYSAYDADSEGEEGKFYLWTLPEVEAVLGADTAAFASAYDITAKGNYYEEATGARTPENIPHLKSFPTDPAAHRAALAKLRAARAKRVWPMLDDKVLTSWNGLMIGALATAGRVFDRPDYVAEAERTASFLLANLRGKSGLLRSWRAGEAKIDAYLDDYAYLANGLLDLHEATQNDRWRNEAIGLVKALDEEFADATNGGYFFTSKRHETMLARNKEPFDNATPAPNGIVAQVLARLAARGEERWVRKANWQLDAFSGLITRVPTAMPSYLEAWLLLPRKESVASTAQAEVRLKPVTLRLTGFPASAKAGQAIRGTLEIAIDDGYHLNANPPSLDYLKPLVARLAEKSALTLAAVPYPSGHDFKVEGEEKPISVYEGTVTLPLVVSMPAAATGSVSLALEVDFQACNAAGCERPQTVGIGLAVRVE